MWEGNESLPNLVEGTGIHSIQSEESPLILDLKKKSEGTTEYFDLTTDTEVLGERPGLEDDLVAKNQSVHKLGQWPATAICGNDITSSCLYVIGVSVTVAGVYSPVGLLLVAFILYLYRGIYSEVGSALPLNGASYTLLLNTTTKVVSGLAACLTLISYVATAVVSGYSAVNYAVNLWDDLPIVPATIGLLFAFAILTILGITESSIVALIIFSIHIVTLIILEVCCIIYLFKDQSILIANFHAPSQHSIASSIFFGFGAGMLGITGFETSANFIEEQGPGVFPKTLRNMWGFVAWLNPTLAFLAVSTLSIPDIVAANTDVLAKMAQHAGGPWLRYMVSIDAVMVLSGGVLTSYVGVTGLVRRMSLDRLLPQYFLKVNRWRGTNHFIIVTFFLVCTSMFVILFGLYGGKSLDSLAGVYTIAFLSVMFLFAVGDFILKYKRRRIPRETRAIRPSIFIAMFGCIAALIANIMAAPRNLSWFAMYYTITAVIVMIMYLRAKLLKLLIHQIPKRSWTAWVLRSLIHYAHEMNHQTFIFLATSDNIALMNKAVLYVRDNEITDNLKVVHIYEDETPENLERMVSHVKTLDSIYPKMKIDFVGVKGKFEPETVNTISSIFNVPKNLIFISCPSSEFPTKVDELGGVRIITTD